MHYFIDGYNMLFRIIHGDGNLQSQRETFILDLNKKISVLKLDVSIVFDATCQIGERSRSHYDSLEILYTGEGETADEYILDELKNTLDAQQQTIVTSDKKLAWLARLRGAHTEAVEEFISRLNRIYRNKLKQNRFDQARKSSPKVLNSPPKKESEVLIPPLNSPLESCIDYYTQTFEAEYQQILKEEKKEKLNKKKKEPENKLTKKARHLRDPFQPPQPSQKAEVSDMERWLKIFENRVIDPNVDFFSKH